MKDVQIIDGAANCTFSVFEFSDEQFGLIFPMPGQDIAFAEEIDTYLTDAQAAMAFLGVWDRPVCKPNLSGLHGTIFYGFQDRKASFPVSRREYDWNESSVNAAQRAMNAALRASAD